MHRHQLTASTAIALVGMPGSGKSTVGRHLARQIGRRFVDSDAAIESRIGMPIRDFFAAHGEEAFRDIEQDVIDELTRQGDIVLATGGGAVLRPSNRDALHARTHVFYLRASPEELHRRLRHDTQRPLLQVDDPLQKLRDLFRERDPLYRRVAHYVVESQRPSVSSLLGMVSMQLELAGLLDDLPHAAGSPEAVTLPSRDEGEGEGTHPLPEPATPSAPATGPATEVAVARQRRRRRRRR